MKLMRLNALESERKEKKRRERRKKGELEEGKERPYLYFFWSHPNRQELGFFMTKGIRQVESIRRGPKQSTTPLVTGEGGGGI